MAEVRMVLDCVETTVDMREMGVLETPRSAD